MSMRVKADVLIIGAGIMGASCAFRLGERGLKVVVLEAQMAPAMGSTGRSAAGVRVQYTEEVNARLKQLDDFVDQQRPAGEDDARDHGVQRERAKRYQQSGDIGCKARRTFSFYRAGGARSAVIAFGWVATAVAVCRCPGSAARRPRMTVA